MPNNKRGVSAGELLREITDNECNERVADKLPDATLQEDEKLLTLYDMALTRSEEN